MAARHLETSTFVLRGRRDTCGTGLALVARLGWDWSPVTPRNFAWQARHLATSTFVSRGRRGTWRHAWQVWYFWHWAGSDGSGGWHHFVTTTFHTPSSTHPLSHTTLSHTPSFTHHLSHPTLSPTIFHTPLCHPPSLAHHLSHTTFKVDIHYITYIYIYYHIQVDIMRSKQPQTYRTDLKTKPVSNSP